MWIDHAHSAITDAYRQRLENEIGYFAGKTDTGNSQISLVIFIELVLVVDKPLCHRQWTSQTTLMTRF